MITFPTWNAKFNYVKIPHCPVLPPAGRWIERPLRVDETITDEKLRFGYMWSYNSYSWALNSIWHFPTCRSQKQFIDCHIITLYMKAYAHFILYTVFKLWWILATVLIIEESTKFTFLWVFNTKFLNILQEWLKRLKFCSYGPFFWVSFMFLFWYHFRHHQYMKQKSSLILFVSIF
jgi:hypothetical protein